MKHNRLTASLNFELNTGEALPEKIELIPPGIDVAGRDGRRWINDKPEAVIEAFNADGRDLVIDFEHATELKAPNGDPAPASGWITGIEIRDGGVWGAVNWNPAGQAAILNREYRYYSPVFLYEKGSGRIVKILSVGLTNRPNLRIPALNHQSRDEREQEDIVMIKKLLQALGLAEDATEEAALNAVSKLKTDLATAANRAETPSLDKFVPRADYDAALAKAANAETAMKALKAAELDKEIAAEIDGALKAGKITPATKDFYAAMCRQESGLAEFRKFLAAAPVIGDPSHLDNQPPRNQGVAMNADQAAIIAMFGLTPEDVAKYGE
jgi:phage I-like protein